MNGFMIYVRSFDRPPYS